MIISEMYAAHMASMLNCEAERLERLANNSDDLDDDEWVWQVDPVSIARSRETAQLFSKWHGATLAEKEVLYNAHCKDLLPQYAIMFRKDLEEYRSKPDAAA